MGPCLSSLSGLGSAFRHLQTSNFSHSNQDLCVKSSMRHCSKYKSHIQTVTTLWLFRNPRNAFFPSNLCLGLYIPSYRLPPISKPDTFPPNSTHLVLLQSCPHPTRFVIGRNGSILLGPGYYQGHNFFFHRSSLFLRVLGLLPTAHTCFFLSPCHVVTLYLTNRDTPSWIHSRLNGLACDAHWVRDYDTEVRMFSSINRF